VNIKYQYFLAKTNVVVATGKLPSPVIIQARPQPNRRTQTSVIIKWHPSAYVTTTNTGSFVLTGNNANLLYGHKILATVTPFTLTGNNANLLHGYRTVNTVGVFNLTGNAANLLASHVITASVGIFNLTGIGATLTPSVIPPSIPIPPTPTSGSGGSGLGSGGGRATLPTPIAWRTGQEKWLYKPKPKITKEELEKQKLATILADDEEVLLVLAGMNDW